MGGGSGADMTLRFKQNSYGFRPLRRALLEPHLQGALACGSDFAEEQSGAAIPVCPDKVAGRVNYLRRPGQQKAQWDPAQRG